MGDYVELTGTISGTVNDTGIAASEAFNNKIGLLHKRIAYGLMDLEYFSNL